MNIPDFIVIGAMKAGTTSLYNYLDKHPEIADIFRPVVEMLDDETMQQLNYEVDVNGKPAKMVAEIFLKEHGFIE